MGRKFRLAVHRKNEYLKPGTEKRGYTVTVEEQKPELTVSVPLNQVHLPLMISIQQNIFFNARVHTLMEVVQRLKTKPMIPEV